MSLGMSYDEFWLKDPWLVKYYREAEELRKERINTEMFMQSRYNYEAFKAVIDNFAYGLSGSKGKRPDDFRKYPYAITERERQAEKQRKIKHTLDWVAEGQK